MAKPRTSPIGRIAASGFTLFELMVVLGIVALIAALAAPTLMAGRGAAELKSATSAVTAGLRQARTDAIFQAREVPFVLDVDQRVAAPEGRKSEAVPPSIELTFRTAESELVSETRGAIRFYPDGSSTGGWIKLARTDDTRGAVKVSVDWLTGRVSVAE